MNGPAAAFEPPPPSRFRSVSGSHHLRAPPLPPLPRSATASRIQPDAAAPSVEIGTKGSIWVLVRRDACEPTGPAADDSNRIPDASYHYHVWHQRLRLLLPSASKKRVGSAKECSRAENSVSAWTTVLRRLKRAYRDGKYRSKFQGKGAATAKNKNKSASKFADNPESLTTTHTKTEDDLAAMSAAERVSMKQQQTMILQTRTSHTATLCERRNFIQINPLDLSHLQTSKLKKALANRRLQQ